MKYELPERIVYRYTLPFVTREYSRCRYTGRKRWDSCAYSRVCKVQFDNTSAARSITAYNTLSSEKSRVFLLRVLLLPWRLSRRWNIYRMRIDENQVFNKLKLANAPHASQFGRTMASPPLSWLWQFACRTNSRRFSLCRADTVESILFLSTSTRISRTMEIERYDRCRPRCLLTLINARASAEQLFYRDV